MADLRLNQLTKSYPLSGNERIPISQTNSDFDNQLMTVYMSPSSLNTFINNNIIPVGTIWPYAGIVNNTTKPLPFGWLLCDGSEISTTTYKSLYSVIGEAHGIPSTVGMFKLPDMRCRFVMGYNSTAPTFRPTFGNFSGPSLRFGQLSGIFTYTLSLSETPSHNHECTISRSALQLLRYPGSQVEQDQEDDANKGQRTYSGRVLPVISLSASYVGGNSYHNTTPPYVAMHYIIKY